MNHLHREIAPIDDEAWRQVDADAKARLTTYLAARRLVDFRGPLGWTHAAVNLGRVAALSDFPTSEFPTSASATSASATSAPKALVEAGIRQVVPLAEVRVPFTLSRRALDDAARGNDSVDLHGLDDAARTIATLENKAIFHGWTAAGITGMTGASSHLPVALGSDEARNYPKLVATAVERLALAGVGGSYALALGDDAWVEVVGSTERGSTLLTHLGKLLEGGPIVWAPGVEGAVVASHRGGDFELVSGQDLAIGYRSCDLENVTLYLEESFTFRVLEPDAAVAVVFAA